MSSYDTQARTLETQQQAEKGEGSFLTPQERSTVQRFLGFPEEFPPEFKDWLIDFLAVNIPQIPISQITGFGQFTATVGSRVDGQSSTTSSSYVELDGGHPQITGLGKGSYLIYHGCALEASSDVITARQSLKFNEETPVSDNAILGEGMHIFSASRVVQKTFTGPNNTIKCVYAQEGGGTAYFELRWIIAIKYAN
jgi:hypothetical protein